MLKFELSRFYNNPTMNNFVDSVEEALNKCVVAISKLEEMANTTKATVPKGFDIDILKTPEVKEKSQKYGLNEIDSYVIALAEKMNEVVDKVNKIEQRLSPTENKCENPEPKVNNGSDLESENEYLKNIINTRDARIKELEEENEELKSEIKYIKSEIERLLKGSEV